MATMPPDDAAVEVASNVDVTALGLSHEEGYLLSCAFGRRQPLKELLQASGLADGAARALALGLIQKGVLVVLAAKGAAADASRDEYGGVLFDVVAMREGVDLSEAQKKRILFVEMQLERWNHYALLGLKRTATISEVKKGYFKASKEFHPDAYFRKNLGSYKPRIDKIFRKMKAAYDVLNDAARRDAYDAALDPADFTPEEQKEIEAQARERRLEQARVQAALDEKKKHAERDTRNAARLKDKRLKHNPMVDRLKRSRDLLELAANAHGLGKLVEAARHARLAKEFAPQDEAIAAAAEPYLSEGAIERARQLVKKAEQHLIMTDHAGAAALIQEAAEAAPRDGHTLQAVAKLSLRLGLDRQAMKFAQRATEVAPGDAGAWRVLLELSEAAEGWHTALRAAERLLALSPKEPRIKDRLKQAKRLAK